jgi:hypothetical protein
LRIIRSQASFSPGSVGLTSSLIGDASGTGLTEAPLGAADANGNLIGGPVGGAIDPGLAALADNGGTTQTHALFGFRGLGRSSETRV